MLLTRVMSKATASDVLHGVGLSCSPDGSNRPSHKQVEQYRRMKAKEYFEDLRDLLPASRDTRCDRNKILQEAIEYLKELQGLSTPRDRGDEDDDGLQFEMEDDSPKKEGDTRHLSHNQVEQRRRQLAKSHFEELRALLPDAGKFDKNAILLHTIKMIRRLSGQASSSASSPSPTNQPVSRSAPTSWRSHQSFDAADSVYGGLSGLSQVASSLSSASDVSDMLSSSCPEGRGRKRSPESVLLDESWERKRRVSDVMEEEVHGFKEEARRSELSHGGAGARGSHGVQGTHPPVGMRRAPFARERAQHACLHAQDYSTDSCKFRQRPRPGGHVTDGAMLLSSCGGLL